VAHDPIGAGVLDRAQVQLALAGGVLGDVGQPQPVRGVGCELSLDQVVVHRRSWFAARAALAGVVAEDPLLRAQPVDPVTAGHDPVPSQLVGDEPVAELGIVVVDVNRGVDQVRVVPVPMADRVGPPPVERLLGEAEHPAGHRDRDAVGGQVEDQREHHFGRVSRAK
jgi:hypothetical protein